MYFYPAMIATTSSFQYNSVQQLTLIIYKKNLNRLVFFRIKWTFSKKKLCCRNVLQETVHVCNPINTRLHLVRLHQKLLSYKRKSKLELCWAWTVVPHKFRSWTENVERCEMYSQKGKQLKVSTAQSISFINDIILACSNYLLTLNFFVA